MNVMTDNKKPWYIWLSLFGFMFIAGDTSRRIKMKRDNFDLWIRACLHMWKLMILYIIIPIPIGSFLVGIILDNVEFVNTLGDYAGSYIMLIILYFLFVIATYRHVVWRRKNIPHLLGGNRRNKTMRVSNGAFIALRARLKVKIMNRKKCNSRKTRRKFICLNH